MTTHEDLESLDETGVGAVRSLPASPVTNKHDRAIRSITMRHHLLIGTRQFSTPILAVTIILMLGTIVAGSDLRPEIQAIVKFPTNDNRDAIALLKRLRRQQNAPSLDDVAYLQSVLSTSCDDRSRLVAAAILLDHAGERICPDLLAAPFYQVLSGPDNDLRELATEMARVLRPILPVDFYDYRPLDVTSEVQRIDSLCAICTRCRPSRFDVITMFTEGIFSDSSDVRCVALLSLLAVDTKAACEAAGVLVDDESSAVRAAAVMAAVWIQAFDPLLKAECREIAIDGLGDADASVREFSLQWLSPNNALGLQVDAGADLTLGMAKLWGQSSSSGRAAILARVAWTSDCPSLLVRSIRQDIQTAAVDGSLSSWHPVHALSIMLAVSRTHEVFEIIDLMASHVRFTPGVQCLLEALRQLRTLPENAARYQVARDMAIATLSNTYETGNDESRLAAQCAVNVLVALAPTFEVAIENVHYVGNRTDESSVMVTALESLLLRNDRARIECGSLDRALASEEPEVRLAAALCIMNSGAFCNDALDAYLEGLMTCSAHKHADEVERLFTVVEPYLTARDYESLYRTVSCDEQDYKCRVVLIRALTVTKGDDMMFHNALVRIVSTDDHSPYQMVSRAACNAMVRIDSPSREYRTARLRAILRSR